MPSRPHFGWVNRALPDHKVSGSDPDWCVVSCVLNIMMTTMSSVKMFRNEPLLVDIF